MSASAMSATRNGKIARLPQAIREQLNRRLDDGEPGKALVVWLNEQPDVKEVLQEQFGGRPISEQNLSEWKQGGYRDWLRHQESCDLVGRLAEEAEDLESVAGEVPVSECLAPRLAVELARTAKLLLAEDMEPQESWRRLREILQELGQMRRHDHRVAQLRLEGAKWQYEELRLVGEDYERKTNKLKKNASGHICGLTQLPAIAALFGGGEQGWEVAALLHELKYELPPGTIDRKPPADPAKPAPVPPDQAGSNPIKPDQSESTPTKPAPAAAGGPS